MAQPMSDDLAHVRAEFERWRSEAAGRGRIPDRLWRVAISLLHNHALSPVGRELHLIVGDLKKRVPAAAVLDGWSERLDGVVGPPVTEGSPLACSCSPSSRRAS
jgi:hypothetical protein